MARHTTGPSFQQLASSLLLAVILSGCASQQTLRVIDAKSGEPLGDVRVERLKGAIRPSSIPLVVLNELTPAEKQTTNASGAATFEKSGRDFMVNPSGTDPTYNHAYVTATWSGAKVSYPGEHREISVTRKNGVVEIPLERRWSGGEGPRPDKALAVRHEENRSKSDTGDVVRHDDRAEIADTRRGN